MEVPSSTITHVATPIRDRPGHRCLSPPSSDTEDAFTDDPCPVLALATVPPRLHDMVQTRMDRGFFRSRHPTPTQDPVVSQGPSSCSQRLPSAWPTLPTDRFAVSLQRSLPPSAFSRGPVLPWAWFCH